MKQISETDIENIKSLLKNRNSYHDIKIVLDNLEDIPQEKKKEDLSLGNPLESQNIAGEDNTQRNMPVNVDNHLADILKDLKELLHKGRSSILESDIRGIINKYG